MKSWNLSLIEKTEMLYFFFVVLLRLLENEDP